MNAAMNFTVPEGLPSIVDSEPITALPVGYDLTAEDVAKYYGVKTAVITWRARHGRLNSLKPIRRGRDWWFASSRVAVTPLDPAPSPSYRLLDQEPVSIAELVATRAEKLKQQDPEPTDRARYEDRAGFLDHLRSLAVQHGPRYLRTYNVQKKLGKTGQALYSAALYHCGTWARAVDEALKPLGLTYEQDVKCQRPWACANNRSRQLTHA